MIKVKMLFRHHGKAGKMEEGLIYHVSADYANELVKHGLAKVMAERNEKPIFEEKKPIIEKVKQIGQVRSRAGRFMPKNEE